MIFQFRKNSHLICSKINFSIKKITSVFTKVLFFEIKNCFGTNCIWILQKSYFRKTKRLKKWIIIFFVHSVRKARILRFFMMRLMKMVVVFWVKAQRKYTCFFVAIEQMSWTSILHSMKRQWHTWDFNWNTLHSLDFWKNLIWNK